KVIKNINEINITKPCSIYLELLGTNYHDAEILGMAVYNCEDSIYVPFILLKDALKKIDKIDKYTYDLKKTYVALKKQNLEIDNIIFDTMLAAYLLDYNVKDDIAYVANNFDADIAFYEKIYGKNNKLSKPSDDI